MLVAGIERGGRSERGGRQVRVWWRDREGEVWKSSAQ